MRFDGLYFNPEYNWRYASALRFFPSGWCVSTQFEPSVPPDQVRLELRSRPGQGRWHREGDRLWMTFHYHYTAELSPGRVVYEGELGDDTLRTRSEDTQWNQKDPLPLKREESFRFIPREFPDEPDLEAEMTRWLGPNVPWKVHEPDGADLVRVADRFWMHRLPVRVRQFQKVVRPLGRGLPDAPTGGWLSDMPIVKIEWEEAQLYASAIGARLPTVEEWELAWAEGVTSGYIQGKGPRPVWVDPGDVSRWGVAELAGNVAEYTSEPGVVFGGSYRSKTLEEGRKARKVKSACAPWIGFRCVVD